MTRASCPCERRQHGRDARVTLSVFLLLLLVKSVCVRADDLETAFRNPPQAAKPLVWWHWINGNVSKAGITKDLEAMQRVGIGGAHLFNVSGGGQAGPVKFMSPEWLDLVQFSAQECQRLGLEFGIHNCPGWSSSGGPWNKPENGMKTVVTAEQQLAGPVHFSNGLPTPATPIGHYRDIAVLAFRTPAGELVKMIDASPVVTAGQGSEKTTAGTDGKTDMFIEMPRPTPQAPQTIEIRFDKPFAASELALTPGPGMHGCGGDLFASEDGNTFRKICPVVIATRGDASAIDEQRTFPFPRIEARAFRITFTKAHGFTKKLNFAEVELSQRVSINNFLGKAFYDRGGSYAPDESPTKPQDVVPLAETIDLSDRMSADGKLTWDVPEGHWTILRVGFAPNGRTNHPTPQGGEGLECDKLSAAALDAHWAGMITPLMQKLGPLGGTTFNHVVLDSYEVGTQNWTESFREEFIKRRGYDPIKHLVVFSRRIVDSNEVTERFLWDLRRTVADLCAQNYAGRMAELAHRDHLTLAIEPYGDAPADDIEFAAPADVPMTEFWVVKELDNCTRIAASVAHTNGRRIVGCEAFTAGELGGNQWNTDPYALKAVGDLILAAGANRFSLHSYVHQPFDRAPGITLGAVGSQFNRLNTWWDVAGPWLMNLTRTQAMLQQGLPVADVLYYAGEDVPSSKYGDGTKNSLIPKGYDYDACDANVLLNRVTVKDGRLVLPDGMSYRMLVLPPKPAMRPAILERLKQLAADGAVIIGPRPTKAPGLRDFPRGDEQVAKLVEEIWGSGKVRGIPPADALKNLKLSPDFEFNGEKSRLVYDHRRTDDADVYFVSNQRPTSETVECTFRITGKAPELWHPDTGTIEPAPVYRETDGRTIVPLRFDPSGSVFVVFRKLASADHLVAMEKGDDVNPRTPGNLKILKAQFVNLDNPAHGSYEVTEKIAALVKDDALILRAGDEHGPKDHGIVGIKGLLIDYKYAGHRNSARGMQERMIELPAADDLVHAPPAVEIRDGKLIAWQNGEYSFKSADGATKVVNVSSVPKPLEISGSWELAFSPGMGAPDKVLLDKLISWTDHPDAGVRYFSGTATYVKTFDLSAELAPRGGTALYLDLGRMKNVAQVIVNGKDLGVLWKPPFRVDVSSAVKPGANTLEVRVTNLWPNRLIGDQQLPDDVKWSGENVATWPQWMLDGKPSPTGRIAFAARRHWVKGDEPLTSGLFGPVMLRVAKVEAMPR